MTTPIAFNCKNCGQPIQSDKNVKVICPKCGYENISPNGNTFPGIGEIKIKKDGPN